MIFRDTSEIIDDIKTRPYHKSYSYGIPYLDKATGGIRQSDLVVIGGRSGSGKTELANIIAENIATQVNKVVVYSLEAERNEFVNRIIYRHYARELYTNKNTMASYRDYITGNIEFPETLKDIQNKLRTTLQTLEVYERDEEFTIEDFKNGMMLTSESADVIIVDHIHHFDLESPNEFAEMKKIIKQIRDLSLRYNKAIILIAHFRKADRKTIQIVPDMEEFYGSSEISKEATQVITLAPYEEKPGDAFYTNGCPTLFRICKLRIDGSVLRYVGKHHFHSPTKTYDKNFVLARLISSGKEIQELEKDEYPSWARTKSLINGEVVYV